MAGDFREDVVEFLWLEYERLMCGNLTTEDRRRTREAFICGFSGACGIFSNLIPDMTDEDATRFLSKLNGELNSLKEQIRQQRRDRKIIT